MSSILDALDRAARERGQGKSDLPPPAIAIVEASRYPLGKLLLSGLVVIGIVVGVWFLFADRIGQSELRSDENGRLIKPAEQSKAVAANQLDAEVVSGKETLGEKIRNSTLPNKRPLVSEAILSKRISGEGRQTPQDSVEENAGSLPEPPVGGLSSGDFDGDVTTAKKPKRFTAEHEVEEEKGALVPSALKQATGDEQVERQRIPLIWELDQRLREPLEQLKISIHVYHQIASQRFVVINMRRYAEGDTLGINGYRLHAIDRDGIIVDHGAGLVRLLRER